MQHDGQILPMPLPDGTKINFPCEKCGGSGWVRKIKDGRITVERCKECEKTRYLANVMKSSGVQLEQYQKFTLEKFKANTKETALMKSTAEKFLREKPAGKGTAFMGRSGCGKSHISIALLLAMEEYHTYWDYRARIQEIKNAAYRDGSRYDDLIWKAKTAPNLYIDDLFQAAMTKGQIDHQDEQIMFDIINARYRNMRRTFFSSNYTLEDIKNGSTPLARRIYEMTAPYIVNIT